MPNYIVEIASQTPKVESRPIYNTVEVNDNLSTVLLTKVHNTIEVTYSPSGVPFTQTKTVTIVDPRATEKVTISYLYTAITFIKIVAVITGTLSPSIHWTIRYGANLSGGTEIITGGTTTTSLSTVTSFNVPAIPVDSFIWLETSSLVGNVSEFTITTIYS
jgi:hypothetical protein